MAVTILGAGAWGTALAISAARYNTDVWLWGRDSAQIAQMQAQRVNGRYLPDAPLPDSLQLTADLDAAVRKARGDGGLVIIGTPMAALDGMLKALPDELPVLWLCKGFEKGTGRLGHEIAQTLRPRGRHGVLSGPSFAKEVALGQPTALVAATNDPALADQAVAYFHSDSVRVYTSTDPVGVEVGGAVKNVLAIATGIADGLELGLNARAALITRGLAEMTRLGLALGRHQCRGQIARSHVFAQSARHIAGGQSRPIGGGKFAAMDITLHKKHQRRVLINTPQHINRIGHTGFGIKGFVVFTGIKIIRRHITQPISAGRATC
mgnify:CR=1 FL=1